MARYVPRDHLRIIGITNRPYWFPGEWVPGVTSVQIYGGRSSPTVQPDPPTATVEIWGATSEEILSAYVAMVVPYYAELPPPWVAAAWYVFTWTENGEPVAVTIPPSVWRFAGYITSATHTWRGGVPVCTVKLASPITRYAESRLPWPGLARNKEDLTPRMLSYGIAPIPLTGPNDPYTNQQSLDLISPQKLVHPQDPDEAVIGYEVVKRVAAPEDNVLQDLQRLVSGMGGVLRHRRCGQAWIPADPLQITGPPARQTFTNPAAWLIDDRGAGWELAPIVNDVSVKWSPQYDNLGQISSYSTYRATSPPGAYGSRAVAIDSDSSQLLHAINTAAAVLSRRNTGRRILPTLTIDLHSPAVNQATREQVLDLETGNRISFDTGDVRLDSLGLLVVEEITETVTPTRHRITLGVFADDPAVYSHGSDTPVPPPEVQP